DLLLLARKCAAGIGADMGRPCIRLSKGAEPALSAHRWPGNVRELRNVLERAVLLAPGESLEAEDLRESLAVSVNHKGIGTAAHACPSLRVTSVPDCLFRADGTWQLPCSRKAREAQENP